ncbi:MAG TPA: GxxExxY protein [Ignavibacteria bacterium]|nr:GxxExxY protein [Ignavibacteria bacterium]
MINDEYKYSDLTARIIKCAMEVHSYLGNGFMEVVYQRALEYEFLLEGLRYKREIEMDIYYKDLTKPIGNRKVDFLVEEKVLVKTKAIILLDDIHLAQAINYLEAFKLRVGLLINFGSKKLQFRRVMKSEEQLKRKLR